jgi:hypothetical protein
MPTSVNIFDPLTATSNCNQRVFPGKRRRERFRIPRNPVQCFGTGNGGDLLRSFHGSAFMEKLQSADNSRLHAMVFPGSQ